MRAQVADVVVVTGASGGIGRWISARVSSLAGVTVLVGRDGHRLGATAAQCSGDVRTVVADLDVPSSLHPVRGIVANVGPKRLAVVAAAGTIGPIALPGLEDPLEWEASIQTNVIGTYRTVQPFLSRMRDNDWGRVVLVSSAQALHGPDPVMTSYATAKGAVNVYAACLAAHFEGTGVSVCAIHPGDVFTRMGKEILRKAESLGPPAAHLAAWGQRIALDGGDDPREAGELVADILTRPASWSNGRFLLVPSSTERHPRTHWAMGVGPRQ